MNGYVDVFLEDLDRPNPEGVDFSEEPDAMAYAGAEYEFEDYLELGQFVHLEKNGDCPNTDMPAGRFRVERIVEEQRLTEDGDRLFFQSCSGRFVQ